MDGQAHKEGEGGGQGNYIWLRYATQFTAGGRTHTVEMGVPMPLGASEETREQLLREADAGMNQLTRHVERRVAQMLNRARSQQGADTAPPAIKTLPSTTTRPAGVPSPQTSAQPAPPTPIRTREAEPESVPFASRDTRGPAARQNVSASMPSTSGSTTDGNSYMTIPDFVRAVKENFGLDSNQAMKKLGVKVLRGLNLRAELVRLQALLEREGAENVPQHSMTPPASDAAPSSSSSAVSAPSPAHTANPSRSVQAPEPEPEPESTSEEVREERPPYVFNEEVDLEEEGEESLDDPDQPRELTEQEQAIAQAKINHLREMRGATAASDRRLQVLRTLVSSQISKEQLQGVIEGVWSVSASRKLKVDQVEELISWAKEDDFVNEVEAVLVLLEEERYARGNR